MVTTVQSLKSGQTDLLNRKSRKEVSKRKNQLQQITTSPPFSLPHPARNKMVSGRIDRSLARPIQSSVIVAPHRLNLVLDRTILRHDSLHNPSSSSSLLHHQTMIASRGRELGHVPKSLRPHHREISPWRTIGLIRGIGEDQENQHADLDLI